jgi:hypothetical protein
MNSALIFAFLEFLVFPRRKKKKKKKKKKTVLNITKVVMNEQYITNYFPLLTERLCCVHERT